MPKSDRPRQPAEWRDGSRRKLAFSKNHFAVVSLGAPLCVPSGRFGDALVTKEWSPLEPDVLSQKYYLRGAGEAREVVVRGPREEFRLFSVTKR